MNKNTIEEILHLIELSQREGFSLGEFIVVCKNAGMGAKKGSLAEITSLKCPEKTYDYVKKFWKENEMEGKKLVWVKWIKTINDVPQKDGTYFQEYFRKATIKEILDYFEFIFPNFKEGDEVYLKGRGLFFFLNNGQIETEDYSITANIPLEKKLIVEKSDEIGVRLMGYNYVHPQCKFDYWHNCKNNEDIKNIEEDEEIRLLEEKIRSLKALKILKDGVWVYSKSRNKVERIIDSKDIFTINDYHINLHIVQKTPENYSSNFNRNEIKKVLLEEAENRRFIHNATFHKDGDCCYYSINQNCWNISNSSHLTNNGIIVYNNITDKWADVVDGLAKEDLLKAQNMVYPILIEKIGITYIDSNSKKTIEIEKWKEFERITTYMKNTYNDHKIPFKVTYSCEFALTIGCAENIKHSEIKRIREVWDSIFKKY